MKKVCLIFAVIIAFLVYAKSSFAIYDPLSVSNNKFGVHILFPDEIREASRLVNSNGGNWGYVTIPIQTGDKNLVKWQKFMDDAKIYHIIPIIRLATEGDYFNTKVWRKPEFEDVLDFANFLNSLNWPVKNKYIVVYNEPNRGDEWGGSPNPFEYANILNFAVSTFKARSSDFFIISAGLDNAAPTITGQYMNDYDFMRQMNESVDGIFTQIDGLGSHSYPNPGFSQAPSSYNYVGTSSFKFEINLAKSFGAKDIPVFITETGWSNQSLSGETISSYYKTAFENIWSDENIAAITPFLLIANNAPFDKFSLLKNGEQTLEYNAIQSIKKNTGSPLLSEQKQILGEKQLESHKKLVERNFSSDKTLSTSVFIPTPVKTLFKWLLKI